MWNGSRYSQNNALPQLFETVEKHVASAESKVKGKEGLVNAIK